MPLLIVLDTFPASSTAKREPDVGEAWTVLNHCHQWVKDCVAAGHRIVVPAISYYEAVRELERLNAV